jgi:alpha-tubulin suppressor-like RCC1 family protein
VLLPKPIEALRGVCVVSVVAGGNRSFAVADTGELWAWGLDGSGDYHSALGHGEEKNCPVPKPIESLRGIKVDAVAAGSGHALALTDNGSVYAWGMQHAAASGALGLGRRMTDRKVSTPRRVPALRVLCGL